MLTVGLHGVADPAGLGRSHDHGVAIMRNGRVLFSCELERHSRRKHDGNLEQHIESLLEPWVCSGENFRIALTNTFLGAGLRSAGGRLAIGGASDLDVPAIYGACRGELRFAGCGRGEFYSVGHEAAHLGTCLPFFGSFMPGSLLIHIDGGASRSCASAWYFDGQRLECLDYGWNSSLKRAVNHFNDSYLSRSILGLGVEDHLSMPGKLMGLARMGEPEPELTGWLERHGWLHREPASRESRFAIERELSDLGVHEFSPRDRGCQALAACMQHHFEEEVLGYIQLYQQATDAHNLYYSGGAALNVHCNSRIESELRFNAVMIPPAPSDTGLALGAAALLEWSLGNAVAQRPDPFLNSVKELPLGSSHRASVPVIRTVKDAGEAIASGRILGVWVGDAEFGPRALGHRSILARPDSVELRRRASEQMKQREWYRPVAPMMLEEVADVALEGYDNKSRLARYMLGAWKVNLAHRRAFSGCVHEDGSVRAQVVEHGDSSLGHIHALLEYLRDVYGVLGVINTSFNARGEPIVHSLDDAFRAAEKLGLEGLWLPGEEA